MLSLSQTTGYAIQALGCLEGPGGQLILAKDVATQTKIPLPYLSKMLHRLSAGGLITSQRGYRGGWRLTRHPSEICLLEVVAAVEEEVAKPRCLMGLKECSEATACAVHHWWVKERERIHAKLMETTLADVDGMPVAEPALAQVQEAPKAAMKPAKRSPSRRNSP